MATAGAKYPPKEEEKNAPTPTSIYGSEFYLKLLLHPIVRVYTRKCTTNIVEI